MLDNKVISAIKNNKLVFLKHKNRIVLINNETTLSTIQQDCGDELELLELLEAEYIIK